MKRPPILGILGLLGAILIAAFCFFQFQKKTRLIDVSSQLEEIITSGAELGVEPAPGNQVRELMKSKLGHPFLAELDAAHEVFAVDISNEAFACIWNGPGGKQTLFVGVNSEKSLSAGMPSQVSLKEVRFNKEDTVLVVEASSSEEDKDEVTSIFELQPGGRYEVTVETAELPDVDFIQIWKSGTLQSAKQESAPVEDRSVPAIAEPGATIE